MSILWKIILLFIAVLVLLISVFLDPKISVRTDGVTLSLPNVSFYIPSDKPTNIYKFNSKPEELVKIIENNTRDYPATFGIFIKNLSTGQQISLNEDETFPSASLYKLFVMYTLYQKADQGEVNLDDPQIQNNLKSMITVSSNEAAWFLVDKYTSWSEVTKYINSIGLKNTTLNKNPIITTPKDVGTLLELISKGDAVNMNSSVSMLEIMVSQKIHDRIPVHLPPKVIVAHKTGELEDARHDAGVVITPENNYILVLMSKGSENPEAVKSIMSKISKEVYEFFVNQWANPPEIL